MARHTKIPNFLNNTSCIDNNSRPYRFKSRIRKSYEFPFAAHKRIAFSFLPLENTYST